MNLDIRQDNLWILTQILKHSGKFVTWGLHLQILIIEQSYINQISKKLDFVNIIDPLIEMLK